MKSLVSTTAQALTRHVARDTVVRRLQEAEHALAAAVRIDQAKLVMDVSAAQEVFATRQKLGEDVIGYAHMIKMRALALLGELLQDVEKAHGARGVAGPGRGKRNSTQESRFTGPTLAELGVPPKVSMIAQQLADLPEETREAIATREQSLANAIREFKREQMAERLNDLETKAIKAAAGVYDVCVIDPPWPFEKIERDERPSQVQDYPTMTIAEIETLTIPLAADAHVWLWTTQKFLPIAFDVLETWRVAYICTFVWHKPGGFQPINLPQYNCEFALYGRRGHPQFLDTKQLPTCFEAGRGKHSEKPLEFYDMVRRVTAGRRLDMFNRRKIEGFDGWGKEAA